MQVQMITFEPSVLSDSRDQVGECPVWSVAEQALYWVDIEGRKIHRFDWASQTQQTWNTPERVGCIALTERLGAGGGVIAAMETGIFAVRFLDAPDVNVKLIAGIDHPALNMRFNDGRCDARGRFWVSTMCMDMSLGSTVGAVYCLDKAGLIATRLGQMKTPNGMAFSPDGRTYYLSDSHPSVQKIWAFDFDQDTAATSNRRELVDMTDLPGRPDGAAVDIDGTYWICGNDAGFVHQFSTAGVLLRSVGVPVAKPSMCTFGGPNLDILFVTSIRPGGVSADAPGLNGAVFALKTDTRGLPEPLFSRFPVSRI